MAEAERVQLLTRVAQLYYEQSATQEAIASALRISRPTVSRLLKEAREEGVVRIIINSPFHFVRDLEEELAAAFAHLREVRVLRTPHLNTVARAAGAYVAGVVKDGDIIGVSWGNTMAEIAAHLPNRALRSATVVQLKGAVSRAAHGTNAHEVVTRFGQAFSAEMYYLQVPAVVDTASVREVLLQNRETARVLELGRRATVAIYSIGVPESQSVLVQAGYFTPRQLQALRRRGAVGDICSRYFKADGRLFDPLLDACTIGMPLDELSNREQAIAVVSGAHKASATLGALRGRMMNVLIIDEATAREVLRLMREGEPGDD